MKIVLKRTLLQFLKILIEWGKYRMPAANTRFGASGGVTSNNLLWGI